MIAGDILGERARLSPEKTALIYIPTGERLSYAELNERSVRCAQLWMESGIEKGARVGILTQNCIEFIEAFYAAGKTGVIAVPLNPRQTARELEYVVRDAGLTALMYESGYAETVAELRRCVGIEKLYCVDGEGIAGSVDYRKSCASVDPKRFHRVRCMPEDSYCLLYTSGTTGKPKGVIVPHRMVAWNAYNTALCWQLREEDVAPIVTPLCHAGGVGVFLTSMCAIGGTVALHRGFDAGEVWRAVERERYTLMMAVPTIYKMLLEDEAFTSVDMTSVRWFISGGAPLPVYIIEAYQKRGITFRQGYGLTEAGVNCFAMNDEESRRKPGSIGKPFMYTEAKLIGADGGEVPEGEVGELCLRGPHVCRGYWNNPEATAAALDGEGWFHTGDKAWRDVEGFFYIAGRSKDMFISGGVNVYPAEIEAELLLHPSVQDAAVIGVPHEKWGEVGIAFVVIRPSVDANAFALAEYLSGRLAKYKIPREFIFLDALPRTPYGKVIKPKLHEMYAGRKNATNNAS